ncbi:MAG: iron-containing alcohol dehydrogenase [Caldisericia bacterium]|nr:iron-containing alcohol dehydrogenase [Caldisericia bacterium]
MEFNVNFQGNIFFGKGSLIKIVELTKHLGKITLIVTGKRSTKESGSLSKLIDYLKDIGVNFVLFDKIEPNPSVEIVEEGGKVFVENGCESIIAIGGGSSIDAAKAIGVYANYKEVIPFLTQERIVDKKIPPLIAIPTTSGTGSEVTKYTIITYNGKKLAIASPFITPDFAILDPELTLTMTPNIVRDTGIDALSHALEGLFSLGATPISDLFGYEATKIIYKYLPRSFAKKGDYKAKEMMHYASLLAGIQISISGTGIVHGMGYPLTVKYGFPHGFANALLMPYVFKFELPAQYEKMSKITELLNFKTGDIYKDAEKFINILLDFYKILDLPMSLKEVGVKEEDLESFSQEVFKNERLKKIAPRDPKFEDILNIYKNAYFGVI